MEEFTLTLRHGLFNRPFDFKRLVEEERLAEEVAECRVLERDGQRRVRGVHQRELGIIQWGHLDDGVIDPGWLQEAGRHPPPTCDLPR